MLTVKTYIAKSTIPDAGLGCFAAEDIKEGQPIWVFNPLIDRVYTDDNLKLFSDIERTFIETYAYKQNGLYFLCVDNGRFFNHSDKPNTFDPNYDYTTYASKDIKKGEEILSNYNSFGVTPDDLRFNILL